MALRLWVAAWVLLGVVLEQRECDASGRGDLFLCGARVLRVRAARSVHVGCVGRVHTCVV